MTKENSSKFSNGNIVVVDDNEYDLKFLSDLLIKAGYNVRTAISGELALAFVQEDPPDMILVDIDMPGMNGIELCLQVKADHDIKEMPVIFISGYSETEMKVEALESGGIDFLTKPFEPLEVLARINIHLKMCRLQKKLKKQSKELQAEIEERKVAEKNFFQSEDLLKETQKLTKVGGWRYTIENEEMIWTNEIFQIHEMPEDQVENHISESLKCYREEDRPIIMDAFQRVIDEGKPYDLEFQLTTFKNRQIWIRTIAKPVRKGKEIVGVVGNFMDITESKKMIGKLSESEKKYRLMFEKIIIGIAYHKIIIDENKRPIDYIFLELNDSFEKLTGLKRKDLIGKYVTKALPGIENDPTGWIGRYGKVALEGENIQFESFSEPLNKWFSVSAYSPQYGYFVTIFEDITERKVFEEKLQKSENRFRQLTDNAKDMIYQMSMPEGIYEFVSRASLDIFGYTPKEFYDSPKLIKDVIHPDWQNYFVDEWAKLINGDMPPFYEYQIIHKSGEIRWLHQSNVLISDENSQVIAIEGIVSDITERKITKEELKESEQKFKAFSDQSTEGIGVADLEGNYTYVNPALCEMVGWTEKEMLKMNVFDVTADKQDKATFERTTTVEEGSPVTVVLVRKDGSEFLAEVTGKNLSVGEKPSVLGTIRDITEVRKAEEALMLSEERYKGIIQSTASCIAVYKAVDKGTNFEFVYFNKMAEKVEEISADELIGKKVTDVFPGIEEFGLLKVFQNVFKTGKEEHLPVSVYQDSRLMGYRENFVYKLSTGEIVAVYQDFTKRKQIEIELDKHRDHLEELVAERTDALEKKNKELDNALKVFVGRELTIRNLQNKIRKLEGK